MFPLLQLTLRHHTVLPFSRISISSNSSNSSTTKSLNRSRMDIRIFTATLEVQLNMFLTTIMRGLTSTSRFSYRWTAPFTTLLLLTTLPLCTMMSQRIMRLFTVQPCLQFVMMHRRTTVLLIIDSL
jgi:hypothetical protein